MLAKTSAGGLCTAFPDVCLTPAPPAPAPIPIPYPNIGARPDQRGVRAQRADDLRSGPQHGHAAADDQRRQRRPGDRRRLRDGDGPGAHGDAAFTVLVGGMPLARLTSITIQNNTNAPGAKVVPSVTNVLVLAP